MQFCAAGTDSNADEDRSCAGGRYAALDSGDVDVASVFTAEAQLAGRDYVVLEDPRGLFASGHVAPVISDQILELHGPALQTAIDAVSKVLTTPAMREMNAAVDLNDRLPGDVARDYDRALELLDDVGVRELAVFDRRTRRLEPIG